MGLYYHIIIVQACRMRARKEIASMIIYLKQVASEYFYNFLVIHYIDYQWVCIITL